MDTSLDDVYVLHVYCHCQNCRFVLRTLKLHWLNKYTSAQQLMTRKRVTLKVQNQNQIVLQVASSSAGILTSQQMKTYKNPTSSLVKETEK